MWTSRIIYLDLAEIFLWLENLDYRIRQTIEDQIDRLRPIDDEEWVNLSNEEKKAFIDHLKEADRFEPKDLSFDEIRRKRKNNKD